MRVKLYKTGRKEFGLDLGLVEIKFHQPRFMLNYTMNKLLKKSIEKHYNVNIKRSHTIITHSDADYVIVLRKVGSLFNLPDNITESVDKFICVIKDISKSVPIALCFGTIETESERYVRKQIEDTEIFIMK